MLLHHFTAAAAVLWILAGPLLNEAAALAAERQPSFTITDLGSLKEPCSRAYAANAAGQVVGAADYGNASQAFLWDKGKMSGIGTYDYCQSEALDINDTGTVVGWARLAANRQMLRAIVWRDGKATDLGAGTAEAVNKAGHVVGGGMGLGAYMHDGAKAIGLGTLPGHDTLAVAYGINNSDEVVGYVQREAVTRAFYWKNGKMTDLGTLGGLRSMAFAINDSGQIAGWAETADGVEHASVWVKGRIADLGVAKGGSRAYGINNAGEVVGAILANVPYWRSKEAVSQPPPLRNNAGGEAFLWQRGTVTVLEKAITGHSGEWLLTSAADINDAGQVVGDGTHNGTTRAFLLTPTGGPRPLGSAPGK